MLANQFACHVARETEGQVPRARVLCSHAGESQASSAPAGGGSSPDGATAISPLSEWGWGDAAAETKYSALYPRAWTEYNDALGVEGLQLTCKQLSPVVAGEYRDSSAPVGVFVWRVVNESAEDVRI